METSIYDNVRTLKFLLGDAEFFVLTLKDGGSLIDAVISPCML